MCTPWRVEYTDSIENSLLQDGSGYECQGFNEIKKILETLSETQDIGWCVTVNGGVTTQT